MNVPTPEIDSLPAPDRKKVYKLLAERAMHGLTFSYAKLIKLADGSVEAVKACVAAFDEDEAKEEKRILNEGITDILGSNGITSVRGPDQFGITRDLIYIDSNSSSLSSKRLLELAPKFKIPTDTAMAWIEAATVKKSYSTLQCRRVKKEAAQ